jgi:hypothetical protein
MGAMKSPLVKETGTNKTETRINKKGGIITYRKKYI